MIFLMIVNFLKDSTQYISVFAPSSLVRLGNFLIRRESIPNVLVAPNFLNPSRYSKCSSLIYSGLSIFLKIQ